MGVKIVRRGDPRPAVLVNVSRVNGGGGEVLEYVVRSATGRGNFTITDTRAVPQNRFLTANSAETAPGEWKRVWPLPEDPIAVHTTHNLVLQFTQSLAYTYQVTLIRADGAPVPLIDVDFEADDPNEFFPLSLTVVLQ